MAQRQQVTVYNGAVAIYQEPDMKGSSTEHGVLAISGEKVAVVYAPGQWTHVQTVLIDD